MNVGSYSLPRILKVRRGLGAVLPPLGESQESSSARFSMAGTREVSRGPVQEQRRPTGPSTEAGSSRISLRGSNETSGREKWEDDCLLPRPFSLFRSFHSICFYLCRNVFSLY